MSVETALYPPQLNATWPAAADMVSEGDDHIRLTKTVLKTTFPNVAGAVSVSHTEINRLSGVSSNLQSQIDSKGAIAGQSWTGNHNFGGSLTVPAKAQGSSTADAASTAFVQAEWAARLPGYTAPITASSTEINRLVGVSSNVQAQIDSKGAIAGQTWAGTHVFPATTTVGPLTPTIQSYLSTVSADVQAQINGRAKKAGETYSGAHDMTAAALTVATQSTGDNSAHAASTAFVQAAAFAATLPSQAGNAGKYISTDGTNAYWSYPSLKPTDALTVSYTGGRVSSTTEDGVTTTYGYDVSGRVQTISYPRDGKTRTETYTYNPDGSMAGMTASEA